ncbi:UTRA domain-containing protein [Duganella violaceipulchra]|uniref:UTRA domain-containing protein n=1 Tax=Duganella violaceipulchra TaxID=2849652 RepID=UPI00350E3F66
MQETTAVAATPAYAVLLQTEVGQPLLKLTRILYDRERCPVQHLSVHMLPERSRILMDVSVEALDSWPQVALCIIRGGAGLTTLRRTIYLL